LARGSIVDLPNTLLTLTRGMLGLAWRSFDAQRTFSDRMSPSTLRADRRDPMTSCGTLALAGVETSLVPRAFAEVDRLSNPSASSPMHAAPDGRGRTRPVSGPTLGRALTAVKRHGGEEASTP
jgi:hypothetical protein